MSLEYQLQGYFTPQELVKLQNRYKTPIDSRIWGVIQDLQDFADALGVSYDSAKNMLIRDKRFLRTDIYAKLDEAMRIYGRNKKSQFVKAVQTQPSFLRRDHTSMHDKKDNLGRYILGSNFSRKKLSELILANPMITGSTSQRDDAIIDVGKEAQRNLGIQPQRVLDFYTKSPYVIIGGKGYSLSEAKKLGDEVVPFEMPKMYQLMANSEDYRKRAA